MPLRVILHNHEYFNRNFNITRVFILSYTYVIKISTRKTASKDAVFEQDEYYSIEKNSNYAINRSETKD